MRNEIISGILSNKLIAIIRGVKKENLLDLACALYDGGIRFAELTFSADNQFDDTYIAACIEILSKKFDGRLHIGAGTVLSTKQVSLAKDAGAKFIISPDTYTPVIEKTLQLGMVSIPGAMTPSEIQNAHRAGADLIKLFPASAFSLDYIKAVRAPLSHVPLLAVGGVNEHNIAKYLDAGIKGFGIGGNLVDNSLIEKGDFDAIRKKAEIYVSEVQKWHS